MGSHRFNALIITALLEELEPVLAYGQDGKDGWDSAKAPDGFPFHFRELPRGRRLLLARAELDR